MNIGDATIVAVTPRWKITLYTAFGVATMAAIGCMAMLVRTNKKKKITIICEDTDIAK